MSESLPHNLESCLRESPLISRVLEDWDSVDLPNCWLVAGAVVQTYWNQAHDYPCDHGIKDVDIIYFDDADLSEMTESRSSARVNKLFEELGMNFDVKNEARVHLWYEGRFGYPIDRYGSAEAAIETFPTTAGAIGVRKSGNQLEAYAPFGFEDLLTLVVRPNKAQITSSIYSQKVRRWEANWPRLKIHDWAHAY